MRLLVQFTLCMICIVPSAWGQKLTQEAGQARGTIAKIVDNHKRSTAGIIVGGDGKYVFVVTANHVLREKNREGTLKQDRFRVEFFDAHGVAQFEAVPHPDKFDDDLDIALLVVSENPDFPNIRFEEEIRFGRLGESGTFESTNKLRTIGHGRRDWDEQVSRPEEFRDKVGVHLLFGIQNAPIDGDSGGGLFNDEDELIGMILKTDVEDGKAIDIETVLEKVRYWRVPIDLWDPSAARSHRIARPKAINRPFSTPGETSPRFVEADTLVIDGVVLQAPPGAVYLANAIRMRNGGGIAGPDFAVVAVTIAGGLLDASGDSGKHGKKPPSAGTHRWCTDAAEGMGSSTDLSKQKEEIPEDGHPGGTLIVVAEAIDGTIIKADGGDGGVGAHGADGEHGIRGKCGCRPDNGGSGDDGQAGGNGGDAGVITLLLPSEHILSSLQHSSRGGFQGHSGKGGRLGKGAQANRECGRGSPVGQDGREGRHGDRSRYGDSTEPIIKIVPFEEIKAALDFPRLDEVFIRTELLKIIAGH